MILLAQLIPSEQAVLPTRHYSAPLISVLASCTDSFLLTEAALGYATLLIGTTRQKNAYVFFLFAFVFVFLIGLEGFL